MIAVSAGTMLETYDLLLYGYFATILAGHSSAATFPGALTTGIGCLNR
jgi:hypothetical protein